MTGQMTSAELWAHEGEMLARHRSARLQREASFMQAQLHDLSMQLLTAREALQSVQRIARDDDSWPQMAQEVFNLCAGAL